MFRLFMHAYELAGTFVLIVVFNSPVSWSRKNTKNVYHILSFNYVLPQVPCLPWLPTISLFLCLLLMISAATPVSWLVFIVVLALGKPYKPTL